MPPRVSCVICAYNEAPRIGVVLNAVHEHPNIDEVIVVDDGSEDTTAAVVTAFPHITLMRLEKNQGKSAAMARGIEGARGEIMLFLDADLKGITRDDITRLLGPVLSGKTHVSMSLRKNSLLIYRALGIDFVTGERVMPRHMIQGLPEQLRRSTRYGAEVLLNASIIEHRGSITVVQWPRVSITRKSEKVGFLRGLLNEVSMVGSVTRPLGVIGTILQIAQLLSLVRKD